MNHIDPLIIFGQEEDSAEWQIRYREDRLNGFKSSFGMGVLLAFCFALLLYMVQ